MRVSRRLRSNNNMIYSMSSYLTICIHYPRRNWNLWPGDRSWCLFLFNIRIAECILWRILRSPFELIQLGIEFNEILGQPPDSAAFEFVFYFKFFPSRVRIKIRSEQVYHFIEFIQFEIEVSSKNSFRNCRRKRASHSTHKVISFHFRQYLQV